MIEKNSSTAAGSLSAAASSVKQTLVEEGTEFKGSLSSNCPIVVKGKIEGDVNAPSLNVSNTGSVHGTVKVTDLRSAGELSGDFESETVQLSGVVKDNTRIRAKSMEVRLSSPNGKMQVVFGECNLDVGEPLSKEDAVRAATQAAAPPANATSPLTNAVQALAESKDEVKDAKEGKDGKEAKEAKEAKGKDGKEAKDKGKDEEASASKKSEHPPKGSVRPKEAKDEEANGQLATADK